MKVEGDIRVAARREHVFARRSAALFLASGIDGHQALNAIDDAGHTGTLCRGGAYPHTIAAA